MVGNVLIKEPPGGMGRSALIVGDPHRVELLSTLLEEPVVKTGVRGYVYAIGKYRGERISIVTHGIGAPSASIVVEELHRLGVNVVVRLGTAGSIQHEIRVGDVILASTALCRIGGCATSMYMRDLTPPASPHPVLAARIIDALKGSGVKTWIAPVFTSDALHAETEGLIEELRGYGVAAVDMETAILYTLSWLRKLHAASVLIVSNNLVQGDQSILGTEELGEAFKKVAKVILEVLHGYS